MRPALRVPTGSMREAKQDECVLRSRANQWLWRRDLNGCVEEGMGGAMGMPVWPGVSDRGRGRPGA